METADGASLVRSAHAAPPVLGQHTEQILDWLDSVDAADPLDAMVPAQA
jgi:formyl-CoA transferase